MKLLPPCGKMLINTRMKPLQCSRQIESIKTTFRKECFRLPREVRHSSRVGGSIAELMFKEDVMCARFHVDKLSCVWTLCWGQVGQICQQICLLRR